MKYYIIIVAILCGYAIDVFGQNENNSVGRDSIKMEKVFGGYNFYQGDQKMNLRQTAFLMLENDEAYNQIRSAQSTRWFGFFAGFSGGLVIVREIVKRITKSDWNAIGLGIGGALTVGSVPIYRDVKKQVRQAVNTYNAGLKTSEQ